MDRFTNHKILLHHASLITVWKVSKDGVFLVYGKYVTDKTPYLNTFHTVDCNQEF